MPSQFMFLFEGNMFHKKNVSEEYQQENSTLTLKFFHRRGFAKKKKKKLLELYCEKGIPDLLPKPKELGMGPKPHFLPTVIQMCICISVWI